MKYVEGQLINGWIDSWHEKIDIYNFMSPLYGQEYLLDGLRNQENWKWISF